MSVIQDEVLVQWIKELQALETRYEAYWENYPEEDSEVDERGEETRELKGIAKILQDACSIIRQAERANTADMEEILKKVGRFINETVRYTADNTSIDLKSFAHEEDTLVQDLRKRIMGHRLREVIDLVMQSKLAEFCINAPPTYESFEGHGPWKKHLQPHSESTPLARFRRNIQFPPADTHPLASMVFQARCEAIDSSVYSPVHLALSSDRTFLALAASGGYKDRDPIVHYCLELKLSGIAYHIALDDARRLIIAADADRVKSYAWDSCRAIHTMKSNNHNGPLAILPGGRLLRAGSGSALVWELDNLQTHELDKKKIGHGTYDTSTTWHDESANIEVSPGSRPHATINFFDSSLSVEQWYWHQSTGYMLCAESLDRFRYSCFSMDIERGALASQYLGHGGVVDCFSTSVDAPHTFVTAASDGYCRLYDMGHPLPQLTFHVERCEGGCETAVFTHLDGIPVLFAGGQSSECISFWDIRAKKLVYELATGNNAVVSMAWDASRSTLYAATTSWNVDRFGRRQNYRRFEKPDYITGADRNSETGSINGDGIDMSLDSTEDKNEDVDVDIHDDDDDGDDDDNLMSSRCWPKRAYHAENYFGYPLDSGKHTVFRYTFKENPNFDMMPSYG